MEKPVLIIGADGTGKDAYDIFRSNGVLIYGFLDSGENQQAEEIEDVSILGNMMDEEYLNMIGEKCEAFVGLDDLDSKKNMIELLSEKRKVIPVNAIHNKATISTSAHISHGILINRGVAIGPFCKIGMHVVLNSNATIEQAATLAEYVYVGSGAILNARVKVGRKAQIGSGAVIASGVKIGKGAKIGPGAVVIADVDDGATLFGNPAKEIT